MVDLGPTKSAGPDNIHPVVLKLCAPVLAAYFAIFLNEHSISFLRLGHWSGSEEGYCRNNL